MTEADETPSPSQPEGRWGQFKRAFRSEYRRIGAFGAVGIFNTIIDFGILNVLHFHFGWRLIPANLLSTTVAMIFSFFANRRVVFRAHRSNKRDLGRQIIGFWAVTAIGQYGIQTSIIWMGTHIAQASFSQWGNALHHIIPISAAIIATNSIKLMASIASLTWNYIWYKKVVFVAR